jgi:Tfp pilus assembly protein PilF
MNNRIRLSSFAAALGCVAVPAAAATPQQLDLQLRATAKVPSGLGLARRQLGQGDLTGALATVERVIILDPLDAEARLLHASLLCRLDDRAGSQTEFDPMRGHDLPEAMWREETAPCVQDNQEPGR